MSVNLKTLHLASPKHKHKFESNNTVDSLVSSRNQPTIKRLSQSSVIENEGEKFYSPLTKKESNNSSNYSDLDAVRQILVSPDLIATSPQKSNRTMELATIESNGIVLDESKIPSIVVKQVANATYSPLISDDILAKKSKTSTTTTTTTTTDLKKNPSTNTITEVDDDPTSNEDEDDAETATIKSRATSNISNKTEKALKYQEMKLSEMKILANELFDHSYSEVSIEDYLTVLCNPSNPESKKLRNFYLKKFNWNPSLLDSLRILCNKLYFRGESQNISRIIESFSIVWCSSFPKNIFGNQYAVYLIAYSLILLNSDLHSTELSKHISKETFVKNTLNALKIEKLYPKDSISALNCLRSYYESIEINELKLLGNNSSSTNENSSDLQPYNHNNGSFANLRKPSFNVSRSSTRGGNRLYKHNNDSQVVKGDSLENSLVLKNKSSVGNGSTATLQQPVGFLHALQRGSSTQVHNKDSGNLKKHRSSTSIVSAVSANTMESSNTLGTYNSVATDMNNSRSLVKNSPLNNSSTATSNGVSHSTSFVSSSLEASDVIIEEDENDMDLELTGPPWAKEGLLRIKKFEKSKSGFFHKNSNGTNNDNNGGNLTNSPSSSHFGSRSFFNHNNDSNSLTRSSTNTSGVGKSYGKPNSNSNGNNSSTKWKLNFTVVSRGELKLFSFNTKSSSGQTSQLKSPASFTDPNNGKSLRKKFSKLRLDRSSNNNNNEPVVVGAGNSLGIGDGNWMRNATLSGTFNLVSTYSKIIPDNSLNNKSLKSKDLETFWALKLPSNYDFDNDNYGLFSKIKKETITYINNDNILIFNAGTREIAEEYVFTCNYWAARLTAIPTQNESVSNKQFGWNNSFLQNTSIHNILNTRIHQWSPLVPSIVSSSLSIKNQLIELFKYVQILENLISDHLKLKDEIDEFIHKNASENHRYLASLNRVFNAIMGNWNTKYSYLVNEHNQFKDYVLTLKEAIDLKQKKGKNEIDDEE